MFYLQVNALSERIIGIYLHEFTNNERGISIPHVKVVVSSQPSITWYKSANQKIGIRTVYESWIINSDKTWIFDQSERAQGPIYILVVDNRQTH